ncbi:uncharacterized protein LOC125749639 isoform X6 [Brienomyrus brachyistius]|uniref:uncharacterized protein LOC125749639 isoform X6 n=1 Tax=Brienomyrus brachyistius TaxID=42636 RepID=UPI0020B321C8|nr:uncharacterized protein LOC125749639 isoform X6 [Brienomyrus brachyistius]
MEKERGKRGAESLPRKRAGSPAPSCVSMKSDKSMGLPPKFSMEPFPPDQSLPRKRAGSPAPSCVSMKSDKSMGLPPKFSEEPFPPDQRDQVERCNSDPHEGDLSSVFKFPEEKAQMLLNDDPADRLEQRHLLSQCQRRMKCDLKKKCECVFEGKAKEGQPTLLSEIYTELYITEGGTGEVNDEHEVRQIETASKKRVTEDTTVKCNDIFKPLCGRETPIRTVLTKGVAGIGKTVSVQKFILDWAEGKANQDVHFIFALPFRNLNLIKDEYSLIELLHHFVPELKSFEPSELFMYKVLFIFDGLDECRLPLDFQNNESWFDVTKRMSLDVLLTNLIKGNLLPSALLWITSRPAAANQIPAKCVHQVTEIRGFSDAQKEEYFRRRFNDQSLASRIISHVKSSRSLFIMCHIPVFCWMSATVLERLFSETDSGEIPKTLTEMYTHFLIFQTTLKNVKYMKNHETKLNEYSKEFLLKLGKLAFDNLEKGNLIFYEQDLSENGIDVTETSVYSGVCTEVFKEEYGLYQEKVYCFVHLSIQEYLAALYVFLSNTSPDLLETAVDQALESKNGHLDLYLRFLLGLSTDSSQNLLQWLLGQTRINSRNVEEMHRYMHPSSFCTPRSALWEFEADFHRRMSRLFLSELGSNPKRDANPFLAQYIKHKIQENLSPERTINLFHCLNELGDNSLVEEVQRYLNSGRLSAEGLSPAQYSALAFVLLMSDEELDVFDMKKFVRSDKEHWRLLPVVKTSKTALLNGCNLTEKCCEALASALRSNSSALRELDLSDNDLSDHVLSDNDPNVYHQQILKLMLMFHRQIGKLGKNSGVKLLSAGLGDSHCKLEILRLSGCRVREEGCSSLASALRSNPSHLRELDLSYNHPGDSGVKLLSAVLEDPSCKLEKLKLNGCNLTEKCCEALASALRSNSSALRELDLSDNDLSDHVLSDNDLNVYHQQILELMLMFHRQIGKLGKNSGVKLLSAGLGDSHCKLEILRLSGCRVREEGCSSLASALRSNPSHLRELDLSYNHPGDSGVKLLSAVLKDPSCKLEKLWLVRCGVTKRGCSSLASALRSNPSHLRELDLSKTHTGDSGVKLLSAVLEDPSCKLEKLKLVRCGVTKRGCSSLASALRSNPSHLRELDLSYNHPGDSGVKLLSAVLKDPSCKLEKLKLVRCGVTKRGCSSLASALRSNPSHLRELDLSKTHTGDSGVKLLSAVLEDPSCKLEKLMLSWCGITEEGCSSLASALRSNPSHLRELDLSLNNPGDSGVMLLSAVLEDPSCKLEKLNGLMERADSPVPSCVSMKSDQSMEPPRNLSDGPFPPDQRDQVKRCNSDPHEGDLSSVFKFPEEKAHMFLNDDPADRLEQTHLLSHCQHRIKHNLKKKCECVFEGKAKEGRPTLLSEIYTELYITEGGTGGVNDEHEVRQIETASKKRVTRDTTVKCNDIIKPLCGRETPIRTVLTKGVAGIGKTVSVQKFILDWAEGKANQDVHFIFALPFRNLNLIKDEYSLIELLHHFVPELKSFEPSELFMYKVLFIFDGLDECRLPLDFQNNESWFDVTKKMSLDVLLTNLIKGNLLPSALLWITSRPAAASQIPAKCVHQVTEIRGFSDAQKEEYFRRRFNDQSLASRIISHVKSSRSLFIMCHIPVFCWMSATVLERLFSETDSGEIPKTLTEMYTHFLIFQTTLKNDKYMKNHETKLNEYSKKFLLKLGKLAFDNLEKGNLIFYEQDLTENDIDVTEASVYSGVCTEVFKEEYGLYQEKVYCFVHLSIQEYLAALYVFLSNTSPDLLETVVDEALESKNGHLDLYLRFLLGLSTDSNQNLLQRLLGQTRTSSHNLEETVKYIKENVQENLSTERTINLFHCLNELGDNSLVEEVQRFLNSERLSAEGLSPAQYSALAFVLLMSDEELDVFDLKKFVRSDKEHWRLLPVVKTSKTALLNSCDLTGECCEELASALRSNSSPLRELDLSDNDLSDHVLQDPGGKPHFARQRDFHRKLDKDSEEKLLSAGLGNSHCKQEILRLNGCDLTEKCCEALASGLRSNSSPLSDNDLSVNDQQDSGVKLLSAGLADSHCKLEILRLSGCRVREEGCSFLASALRSNPSHLRELDLSYNHPGDSGVKLLSAVLEDPSCKLEKLKLDRCELTEKCCEALASALRSNSSPLRELDLSDNDLQESGVKLLSAGLGDSHCKLEILRLSGCRVTEEGCSSLASALRSNPSHLRELDLSYNHPGDSGVKLLSAVLEDPSCKLEKLNVDQSGECRIRPGFLKYSCHLTLDPNTAHRCLSLSEGNRKVQWVEEEPYPDHPERFDRWKQVLCRESLTGRCYWEAEWWGADPRIGVTYKGIRRKGESDDCGLGFNEKSWILSRHNLPSIYFVQHNNKRTDLPRDTPIPPRVGVYLDWEAGTLCFYSVFSDGLTLLHRFTSTFTEPLCPGLAIGANRPGFEDHHPYGVLSLRTLE